MSFDPNNSSTWACRELHNPPEFDVAAYQEKIDAIFGLSDTGMSIVRLVWAPDILKCYTKFFTSWIGLQGAGSELRARYKFSTIQIPGTPDIIDIPPPRWILEEFNHPGQVNASWEAARWAKDGREMRPPPPPEGHYSHLITIARHSNKCCKHAKKHKVVCWGKFRNPAETDLEILRRAKAKRDEDIAIDITKPLTEADLARVSLDTKHRIEEQEAITQEQIKEFVDANALELLELYTGRKFSDKTKKFSIPRFNNQKTTEAGLIISRN